MLRERNDGVPSKDTNAGTKPPLSICSLISCRKLTLIKDFNNMNNKNYTTSNERLNSRRRIELVTGGCEQAKYGTSLSTKPLERIASLFSLKTDSFLKNEHATSRRSARVTASGPESEDGGRGSISDTKSVIRLFFVILRSTLRFSD